MLIIKNRFLSQYFKKYIVNVTHFCFSVESLRNHCNNDKCLSMNDIEQESQPPLLQPRIKKTLKSKTPT